MMITVRPVSYLEYAIAFAGCRTALSDFYVKNKGNLCRIVGAFDGKGEGKGILLYQAAADEIEILYVGVTEKHQGVGTALLKEAIKIGRDFRAESLLLRVCKSQEDETALSGLAEKMDFQVEETVEIFRSDKEDYGRWKQYMRKHGNKICQYLEEQGFSLYSFAEAPEELVQMILEPEPDVFDNSLAPLPILEGEKGRFCKEISFLAARDGQAAAYCLVCQPSEAYYVFEIISAATAYQRTGVIFLPFAASVNAVEAFPYRKVGFAMYQKNKKALALSERVMKSLISSRDLQYNYKYKF